MATILYKDGEAHRVATERVQRYLSMGYSPTEVAEPVVEPEDNGAELEAAREMYAEKFGKKPHHKMTADTILSKLSEADD